MLSEYSFGNDQIILDQIRERMAEFEETAKIYRLNRLCQKGRTRKGERHSSNKRG
ncbi:MAG: hypothetical protein JXR86_07425 [Spirochaetales bacterium]|nr:hypothetical protein [Spirochaetales bacterium]